VQILRSTTVTVDKQQVLDVITGRYVYGILHSDGKCD